MAPLSTAARRVALVGTLAVLFVLLFASPAAAPNWPTSTRRTAPN